MKRLDLYLSLLFSILYPKAHLIDGFSALSSTRQRRLQPASTRSTGIPLTRHEFLQAIGRTNYGTQQWSGSSTELRVAVDPSAIVASLALLGSCAGGMQCERRLPTSGILGTLVTAALISNVTPMVPRHHSLYDLCWSWVLPGSLALLLLGYRTATDVSRNTTEVGNAAGTLQRQNILNSIGRVAGPFVLASVGSILGCWVSYRIAVARRWFPTPAQARAATSCLAASYVGGSVNLFATAKIIQAPKSLLSSMATADLIAMALYFSVLSSAMEWKWLKSLFFVEGHSGKGPEDATVCVENSKGVASDERSSPWLWSGTKTKVLSTIPPLLGLTWAIVAVANKVESFASRWIPGTACGVIAVVAPLLQSILYQRKWIQDRSREWTLTASTVSDGLFFLFFASIGVGVDLRASVEMGPACLMVSLLALKVHLLVIVIGSYLCLPTKRWGITLEDLWIASNAAIGGPATAAAFCSRMKSGNPLALWGRTVAATVWGVVGYAIGTVVGVGFHRFLAPST